MRWRPESWLRPGKILSHRRKMNLYMYLYIVHYLFNCLIFYSSPKHIFIGEREIYVRETWTDCLWLPPVCSGWAQSTNLGPRYWPWPGIGLDLSAHGMVLRPTEPHRPGLLDIIYTRALHGSQSRRNIYVKNKLFATIKEIKIKIKLGIEDVCSYH